MDFARLVFPVPGGPTRSRIGDLSTIRFDLRICNFVVAASLSSSDIGSTSLPSVPFLGLRSDVSVAICWSRSELTDCFNFNTARYSNSRFLIFSSP